MIFDPNQTEFPSKHHERVWTYGRKIVPFEISTAEITDKEMLEGLRQIYDFTAESYKHVYENLDKYLDVIKSRSFPHTAAITEYKITYFHIFGTTPEFSSTNWPFQVDENKYPLFAKYNALFYTACKKRKVYVDQYISYCNFKVFNKRLSMKIEDTIRPFPEKDKAFALELHNYLAAKGIKPRLFAYGDMLYEYNKHDVFSIQAAAYFDVTVYMRKTYTAVLGIIQSLPNKSDLLKYITDNMRYCKSCASPDTQKNKCIDRLKRISSGEQNVICQYELRIRGNREKSSYSFEKELGMIKQILDLHLSQII